MNKNEAIGKNYSWLIYALFFVLFFTIFYSQYDVYGDDGAFFSYPSQYTLKEFLVMHFIHWSSRLFIEICFWPVLLMPIWVWALLCSLVMFCLIKSYTYLVGAKSASQQILVGLMIFSVPFYFLDNSGWVVTTSYYIFPLVMAAFSMCALKDVAANKPISPYKSFLYLLATLIAGNMEQCCVILLMVYGAFLSYFYIIKKKYSCLLLGQFFILLFDVALFFITPGNENRMHNEMKIWLPQFEQWSFFDKLWHGMAHFFDYMFIHNYFFSLFFLLLVILGYFTCFYQKKKVCRGIFLVGLVALLSILGLRAFLNVYFFGVNSLGYYYLLPFLAMASICGLLYYAMSNIWQFMLCLVILAGGFLSVALLGFSPTLYASNLRIFIPFIYTTLGVILYISMKFCDKQQKIGYILYVFALYCAFMQIYQIIFNRSWYLYFA